MIAKGFVKVTETFSIRGLGLLAELQHNENGLRKGIILRSENGAEWTVKSRVFYSHAGIRQKKFECEIESLMISRFVSIENREASAKKIIQKEEQNIYSYFLKKNVLKPDAGDILEIIA
jgi:hypothetical protein